MLKLIVGLKGSGKTKALIDSVNSTVDTTDGTVVCIEKGTKLIHEVKYQARLVNTEEYSVFGAEKLFGFIAGMIASDHDCKDIFVDSALKICNNDIPSFEQFISAVSTLADNNGVTIFITASVKAEDLSDSVKNYI